MTNKREAAIQAAQRILKEKNLKFYKLVEVTDSRFEIHGVEDNSFICPLIVHITEIEVIQK